MIKPNVLYVEDEPRNRLVMRILLVNNMHLENVHIFEDSQNFLSRAEALDPKPDVIFLDIHVAPHDGFEMLEMLRKSDKFSDSRIVALTASVMNEEVQKLKDSGFDGCLAKPIDSDTFPEILNAIVEGKHVWNIIS